jgi:hypothetical protein
MSRATWLSDGYPPLTPGLPSEQMRPTYGHLRERDGQWSGVTTVDGRSMPFLACPIRPEVLLNDATALQPATTWRGRVLRAVIWLLRLSA